MQQKNSAGNIFSGMQDTFKDMIGSVPTASPFDLRALMEAQRKNIQALTEANQRAFQGWQTLAQRQTEMVSQFVQDNSTLARESMNGAAPQDKLAKQAEIIQSAYAKSIGNTQELGEIMRKITTETAEVLNNRVVASIAEIKISAQKTDK